MLTSGGYKSILHSDKRMTQRMCNRMCNTVTRNFSGGFHQELNESVIIKNKITLFGDV